MENEEKPIKSTVYKFGAEMAKQGNTCLPEFIENQLEGIGNRNVRDLPHSAEFHEVIESILELLNAILDDTIQIMDDDDVDDPIQIMDDDDDVGLLDLSNDKNCSAMSDNQQDISDDSGKCSGLNDGFDILTN